VIVVGSLKRTFLLVCAVASLVMVAGAAPAFASSPWWHLTSGARPTNLPPGEQGQVVVTAANLGDASADGGASPVTVEDTLPDGLKGLSVEAVAGGSGLEGRGPVKCKLESGTRVLCTFAGTLPPYDQIEVRIKVEVKESDTSGEVNHVSVAGGDARAASLERPLIVNGERTPFGVEDYELRPEEEGGGTTTQAGSHPYQLTTTLLLNKAPSDKTGHFANTPALTKDLDFKLPPGLIGNPTPFPRCSLSQFLTEIEHGEANECPAQTAVGVAAVTVALPAGGAPGMSTVTEPLFNLEPAVGEPARFGFVVEGLFPVILDTSVRTGGDYGVTVSVNNITQTATLVSNQVTFWGVPGDPSHDNSRGSQCLREARGIEHELPCRPLEELLPPPLLSMPTSCTGRLQTSMEADSWAEPENKVLVQGTAMEAMDGCNRLPFAPSVKVTPDGTAGSTPTGLNVDVHVPQDSVLYGKGLAESTVKDISVTLPEGVALNPAGADGLQACSEGQIGFAGVEPASGQNLFGPGLPEPFCPNASKIGTVKIKTPLLPNALEGAVYLATQNTNPFGSLVAMYIVAEDPVSGTLVKLPGEVSLSPSGQITGTFEHNPQLPFEDAELHFFGGERAPLATPARCGTYTTNASYAPWSGNEPVPASSVFQVTNGPNGTPCPGVALPFSPSLTGGTTSIQAGGFSPFTMTMSREDGQQNLQAIKLHMPPGISGLLSSVKLCGEAQANAGTCGPESEIGETIVSVGLGGNPYSVKGGKVFITEGYDRAPYGLSIVNPAKAGPFDLGQVVVRAKIEVDPITAALTITSDNTGPYKIPTILDGIPLQIKHVNVTINRPGFTFNPTNCNPMSITGALSSTEGATANVSVPLQVTNCAVLGFKPGFSVSTNGKTSRQSGASLHVRLAYPKAVFGSQANIKSVKVDLPKQLPSQLKTLQQACPAATFNANPAGCPPDSRIGQATATTPLLPVSLSGPAYFVSYGGAKFPELVIVLSGYGTTVQLHAETFINKGITSSTFRTIPDVPVGTFELDLPQGKFPALAAPDNKLCQDKLKMPTVFTAQNGAVIKQSTPITVTGCPKHKPTKKARKPTNHKGDKRK
jgi:hypothetical protein